MGLNVMWLEPRGSRGLGNGGAACMECLQERSGLRSACCVPAIVSRWQWVDG